MACSSSPTNALPTTFLLQDDMKTSELCKTSGQVDVEILDLRSRILGLEVGYHVELPLPPSNAMAFNCLLTLMLMSRNEAWVKVKPSTTTA